MTVGRCSDGLKLPGPKTLQRTIRLLLVLSTLRLGSMRLVVHGKHGRELLSVPVLSMVSILLPVVRRCMCGGAVGLERAVMKIWLLVGNIVLR